jgi:hypothetical protein
MTLAGLSHKRSRYPIRELICVYGMKQHLYKLHLEANITTLKFAIKKRNVTNFDLTRHQGCLHHSGTSLWGHRHPPGSGGGALLVPYLGHAS